MDSIAFRCGLVQAIQCAFSTRRPPHNRGEYEDGPEEPSPEVAQKDRQDDGEDEGDHDHTNEGEDPERHEVPTDEEEGNWVVQVVAHTSSHGVTTACRLRLALALNVKDCPGTLTDNVSVT